MSGRRLANRYDLDDYGGDSGPAPGTGASLSWRDDPVDSLSDWRIVVKVGTARPEIYHVHKAIIAAGPRRSEYFTRQCRGGGASRLAEAARCESKLELEAEAAKAIPELLDYVYSGKLDATKENACALFHLANYLANPALHAAVKEFLDDTLDHSTAPMYLAGAHQFAMEKLIDASVGVAAENLSEYSQQVVLPGDTYYDPETCDNFEDFPELRDLYALHPTLFARIVKEWHDSVNDDKVEASRLISDYCARRADAVDNGFLKDIFIAFLDDDDDDVVNMSSNIDAAAAMPLLEMAIKHPGGEIVAKVRDACIQRAVDDFERVLLPLAVREKARRKEVAACAQTMAARKKRKKAGSSNETADEPATALLPLGPGLPVDIQLQLLGNHLLASGGEDPFGS